MNKKLLAMALAAGLALSSASALSASAHGDKGRGEKLDGVLSGLVGKGTITQSQVDAIKKAIEEQHAAARSARVAQANEFQNLIATTIGLDTATITSRLAAGESLGAIAGAKRQALIDALIAFHTKRIDQALADGKITATQASTLKAGLSASVTFFVDRVPGKLHMGRGQSKEFGKWNGGGHGMKGQRGAGFKKGLTPTAPGSSA